MKKIKIILVTLVSLMAITSCQKMEKPRLGDYPKDVSQPGGPLEFYVAFDGTGSDSLRNAVDSMRANFPSVNTGTSTTGISGKGYQGNSTSFVQFGAANGFASKTSFTISFWLNKTPQPAGAGTNFVFGLNTSRDIWTKEELFLEFEDGGQSTTALAAAKFYIQDQWFEFVGAKRMPNVLNGQWHHLAFTYDQTTSKLYTYIDGVLYLGNDASVTDVKNGANPRGALSFTGVSGFTLGGAGEAAHNANSWMGSFDGKLDQFRIYNKALTASDCCALRQ
jgi:hypothetical protein